MAGLKTKKSLGMLKPFTLTNPTMSACGPTISIMAKASLSIREMNLIKGLGKMA